MKTSRSEKSDIVEDQEHNLIMYFNQDYNFLLQYNCIMWFRKHLTTLRKYEKFGRQEETSQREMSKCYEAKNGEIQNSNQWLNAILLWFVKSASLCLLHLNIC